MVRVLAWYWYGIVIASVWYCYGIRIVFFCIVLVFEWYWYGIGMILVMRHGGGMVLLW